MSIVATTLATENPATVAPSKPENTVEEDRKDVKDTDREVSIDSRKGSYGPASPSPRGVETWEPCSPFFVSDPSAQVNMIEPDEISLVLSDHEGWKGRVCPKTRDSKLLVLPQSAQSGFMELEKLFEGNRSPFRVTDRPANDASSQDEKKVVDVSALERHEHDKLIEELFLPLEKDSGYENSSLQQFPSHDGEDTSLTIPNNSCRKECVLSMSETAPESCSVNALEVMDLPISDSEIDERNAPERKKALFTERIMESCQHPMKGERSPLSRGDETLVNVKKVSVVNGTPNNLGYGPGENLSEEDLKRIRRVKNRASVEKCRTKQRLRTEALQMELKALTSENKTLRDLTTWMGSNVNVISTHLAEAASSEKKQSSLKASVDQTDDHSTELRNA